MSAPSPTDQSRSAPVLGELPQSALDTTEPVLAVLAVVPLLAAVPGLQADALAADQRRHRARACKRSPKRGCLGRLRRKPRPSPATPARGGNPDSSSASYRRRRPACLSGCRFPGNRAAANAIEVVVVADPRTTVGDCRARYAKRCRAPRCRFRSGMNGHCPSSRLRRRRCG